MTESPSSSSSSEAISSSSEPEKPTGSTVSITIYEDEYGVSSTTPPLPRFPKHRLTPMVAALIASKCEAEAKEG